MCAHTESLLYYSVKIQIKFLFEINKKKITNDKELFYILIRRRRLTINLFQL